MRWLIGMALSLLGIAVALVFYGAVPLEPWTTELASLSVAAKVAGIAVGSLLALAGLFAMAPRRDASAEVFFEISAFGGAPYDATSVWLSDRAVGAMVVRSAQNVDGVRECTPHVRLGRGGWEIEVRLATRMDAVLPELSRAVRETLSAVVERSTGLPVSRVRIRSSFETLHAPRQRVR